MSKSILFSGIILFCLVFGVCSCSDNGEEVKPVYTGNGKALFDGGSLDGWTVINCEAKVDHGDILIAGGNGLVQTEEKYGDFVLEFDWKPLADDNWDSGVYFRYDSVEEGQPWPKRYQVNLKKGQEGNMSSLKGASSKDLIKPGKWNRFKITVKGETVSVQINGKEAWQAEGLRGPERGFIALQAEVPQGGKHRFRNIYITEL